MRVELVIVRHADAEPEGTGGDAARKLTPLGEQQARDVAAAMARAGLRPRLVLSSPYARTLATAKPIAEAFGLAVTPTPELASGRLDPREVVAMVEAGGVECVVVVGHMPDVAGLHAHLVGEYVEGFAKGEWRVVGVGRD